MATLAVLANPLGVLPGFLVPLFKEPHRSNALLVQRISANNIVTSIDPIDIEKTAVIPTPIIDDLLIEPGDPAIWAFAFDVNDVLVGTSDQIRPSLIAALLAGRLDKSSLLKSEVAKFCAEMEVYREALSASFAALSECSPVGASVWRDSVILLPHVRREVADHLGKTRFKDASTYLGKIDVRCFDGVLEMAVPTELHGELRSPTPAAFTSTMEIAKAFGVSTLEIVNQSERRAGGDSLSGVGPSRAERLAIPDVVLVKPARFGDSRGFFSEVWNVKRLAALGIRDSFVQENQSYSTERGVVRGLHLQIAPSVQGKLVRVSRGAIWDVAVDIRRGSPTYAQHVAVVLSAENWMQVWVPPGFLHGFCTLEPDTEVVYNLTADYDRHAERGVRWDDPDLAIPWPVSSDDIIMSDKDRLLPRLADCPSWFEFSDLSEEMIRLSELKAGRNIIDAP